MSGDKKQVWEGRKGCRGEKEEKRGQMDGCVMIHLSFDLTERALVCEASYGRDDLLDTVMSGISLSTCLPGSVTFDFSLSKHSRSSAQMIPA